MITHEDQCNEGVVDNDSATYDYNTCSSSTETEEKFMNRPIKNEAPRLT